MTVLSKGEMDTVTLDLPGKWEVDTVITERGSTQVTMYKVDE